MNVLHISTFDKGGAAIAAIRSHTSLLDCNIESNILFLFAQNADLIKNSIVYKKQKVKHNFIFWILTRFNLIQSKSQKKINDKLLENKVEGYEMFSFASSDVDLTQLKEYKDADIIHLHWVSNFLNFNLIKINPLPSQNFLTSIKKKEILNDTFFNLKFINYSEIFFPYITLRYYLKNFS